MGNVKRVESKAEIPPVGASEKAKPPVKTPGDPGSSIQSARKGCSCGSALLSIFKTIGKILLAPFRLLFCCLFKGKTLPPKAEGKTDEQWKAIHDEIKEEKKLKKVETVDRSAPKLDDGGVEAYNTMIILKLHALVSLFNGTEFTLGEWGKLISPFQSILIENYSMDDVGKITGNPKENFDLVQKALAKIKQELLITNKEDK